MHLKGDRPPSDRGGLPKAISCSDDFLKDESFAAIYSYEAAPFLTQLHLDLGAYLRGFFRDSEKEDFPDSLRLEVKFIRLMVRGKLFSFGSYFKYDGKIG